MLFSLGTRSLMGCPGGVLGNVGSYFYKPYSLGKALLFFPFWILTLDSTPYLWMVLGIFYALQYVKSI